MFPHLIFQLPWIQYKMTFSEWFYGLGAGSKLAFGFACGVMLYALLRWFIWQANKNLREIEEKGKKMTYKQKMKEFYS